MIELPGFVKEALMVGRLVDLAAYNMRYGSFAARNPTLGKMHRCPYCRIRERAHQCRANLKRCTAPGELPHPKRMAPRLTRNRPPFFLLHQLLVEFERGEHPELENVRHDLMAKYVEKKIGDWRFAKASALREQQKLSRRINWGLV